MLLVLLTLSVTFAEVDGVDGGIAGDPLLKAGTYEYQEVVFITGEPVVLKGVLTIGEVDETLDIYTKTYGYELSNTEKKITLSRKTTYEVKKVKSSTVNQTILTVEISKLDETYTVNGIVYTLGSYLFDKTSLYDNTPAVDYYSGNIYMKRVFYKNGDAITNEGKLTIETNSESLVGYKHKWGALETVVLNQNYNFEYKNPSYNGTTDKNKMKYWSGSATLKMSKADRISFQLQKTDPQNISFRGNYIETKTRENVLTYDYNMPKISSSGLDETKRNKGSESIRQDVVLDNISKITPKIKDIGGYWAEDSIFLLSSLEIYDKHTDYFMPQLNISRIDFIKEVVRSITDSLNKYDDPAVLNKEMILRARPTYKAKENFIDVDPKSKDGLYTEYVLQNGIVDGVGYTGEYFYPDWGISRAEAVKILINALGLDTLAPTPPYSTGYKDDDKIPLWAKDAIYVSNEIGLVSGYSDGYFRPESRITKAEAAVLINKFIEHMKDNITVDYREKIMSKY